MRETATAVLDALASGRRAGVARVVSLRGFGGRSADEAAVVLDDGSITGSLLGGLADDLLKSLAGSPAGSGMLTTLSIGDGEAVAAGLACGGDATVLASDAGLVPRAVWRAIGAGLPVALVTRLASGAPVGEPTAGRASALSLVREPWDLGEERYGTLGDVDSDEAGERLAVEALSSGRPSARVVSAASGERLVVEGYFSGTALVVVGEGGLAEALSSQARLLGWPVRVDPGGGDTAERIGRLHERDAVVVLSHDPKLYTPALVSALSVGCYVGALGARHTQQARRERLAAEGVGEEALSRIHGPVGLDLGARTPAETSVSIVAEILAHRSARRASSLASTDGPING